jgi:hypothetical protein
VGSHRPTRFLPFFVVEDLRQSRFSFRLTGCTGAIDIGLKKVCLWHVSAIKHFTAADLPCFH